MFMDPTGMSAEGSGDGEGFWNKLKSFFGMSSPEKSSTSPIEHTELDEITISANRKPNWLQRNKDKLIKFLGDFTGGTQVYDIHSEAKALSN